MPANSDDITLREYVDMRFREMREYVDTRFEAQEKAVSAALVAQEKAVLVAEGTSDKWRASANEWRGAMDDREANFVKIGEYHLALAQIKEIKETLATIAGRGQGWSAGWQLLMGLATLVAIGVSVFFAVRGE